MHAKFVSTDPMLQLKTNSKETLILTSEMFNVQNPKNLSKIGN